MSFTPFIEEGGVVWNIHLYMRLLHIYAFIPRIPRPPGRTYTHTFPGRYMRLFPVQHNTST
jgi:hypothetical protein